jgi:hypothetical protein
MGKVGELERSTKLVRRVNAVLEITPDAYFLPREFLGCLIDIGKIKYCSSSHPK